MDIAVDEHPRASSIRAANSYSRRMAPLKHAPGVQRNRSLERAASLLRAMSEHPSGASTTTLARASGLPYATAARLLATLGDVALAHRVADRDQWTLGHGLVRLARQADPHRTLIRTVRPALERIADATGESAMLGVCLAPLEIDIVDQVDSPRLVGATRWVGRPFELHASAMGKLALAAVDRTVLDGYLAATPMRKCTARTIVDASALETELQRVRRLGYATTFDELEEGVAGLAVPIYDESGELRACLTLSAPSFRMTPRSQRRAVKLLRAEASAPEIIAA